VAICDPRDLNLQVPGVGPYIVHDPRDIIGTKLNLLAPRMLHAKYQCIPAMQWFMRRFLKIYQNLTHFAPYWAPKESEFPFSKHVFYHDWLKLAQ